MRPPVPAPRPYAEPLPAQQARFDWTAAAQLNPRYTFDGFVIGNGNQFARAASEAPSPSGHPKPTTRSFIYGGVGMGKTHLMHAIGHDMKMRMPQFVHLLRLEREVHQRNDQLAAQRQA